jgi:GNAT superfamily N-acetyltransferase
MNVRIAGRDDIAPLLDLYQHLNPGDAQATVEDGLKNWEVLKLYPGSDIFVACVDDVLVASCTLIIVPNLTRGGMPYALIENVVTHAGHRRQGHGKAVLHAAIDAAWRAGCYKAMLLTGSKEVGTLKFYQEAGFEQSKTGFQVRRIPAKG